MFIKFSSKYFSLLNKISILLFSFVVLSNIIFQQIFAKSNETRYNFIEAKNDEILQNYLPIWATRMIHIERDDSRLWKK